jgi:endonuclease III
MGHRLVSSGRTGETQRVVSAVLAKHGRTYCDELAINIARNTPSVLFRWLCATMLFSARINSRTAIAASMALTRRGWTSARKMAASTWEERTHVLNGAGYARYDESTSAKLGEAADLLLDRYNGDLRRLREEAGRDAGNEHRLIQQFKGIGPVGADIFCREIQAAWPELYPFVDAVALDTARQLKISDTARNLATLVERDDFPRLVAALVRTHLAGDYDEVKRQAAA